MKRALRWAVVVSVALAASGHLFAPWVKQHFYSAIFLAAGAVLALSLQPKEWRRALQPWLFGAALLCTLAAIGIAASPALRVYSTERDEHGRAMHSRLDPQKNVPLALLELGVFAGGALLLRKRPRS